MYNLHEAAFLYGTEPMKHILRFAVALFMLASPALAQNAQTVLNVPMTPLGYQQLTSLSASTALTVPTSARTAIIEADTVAAKIVRWRDDGSAPTATVGMELAVGSTVVYTGNLANLRFIEVAASAKLNVSYYAQ